MARNRSSPSRGLLDPPPAREAARAPIAAAAEEAEKRALGDGTGSGARVGFAVLEKALERVAGERDLPC